MRTFLVVSMVVLGLAIVGPPGCRRMRERVLLTLIGDSERSVEISATDPPVFRFPATPVRVVAVIDLADALTADGHVSFVPPEGSPLYRWAANVCGSWSESCVDATPSVVLSELVYGVLPAGLGQIEPREGSPAALVPGHLYGLALFGERLFVLKAFYRDDAGMHVMDGGRFAEAVLQGRRDEIRAFLGAR